MNLLLDQKARAIMQAFDGCLLMPVRPGVAPDSTIPPLASEMDDHYRRRLATDSLCVLLGRRSGGLLSIRFEAQDQLQAFQLRNPECRSSLLTSHGGHFHLWLRSKSRHAATLRVPGTEVRMSGNFLVLDRARLDRADLILNQAPPLDVNIEALDWGLDDVGAIAVWLTQITKGDFFRPSTRGGWLPNRTVWRSYLLRRLKGHLVYEQVEQAFYAQSSGGQWQRIAESEVIRWLREFVETAPVGTPDSRAQLSDTWLQKVIVQLKLSLSAGPMLSHARLRAFAKVSLKCERGSDVTIGELYQAFVTWCLLEDTPCMSLDRFQRLMPLILRGEPWFASKSKSVMRESGAQNGFRKITLRSPVATPAAASFVGNGVGGVEKCG